MRTGLIAIAGVAAAAAAFGGAFMLGRSQATDTATPRALSAPSSLSMTTENIGPLPRPGARIVNLIPRPTPAPPPEVRVPGQNPAPAPTTRPAPTPAPNPSPAPTTQVPF